MDNISKAEAIESRTGASVGIVRTLEEKNEMLIAYRDSIIARRFWIDCVEHHLKHNEVSDNYRKWVYYTVSECISLQLFGLTFKQLREHYACSDQTPRDWQPIDTLTLIDSIEKTVGVRVKKLGADPKQALKDMLWFMGIEPDLNLL
jgi:hypothetical protein